MKRTSFLTNAEPEKYDLDYEHGYPPGPPADMLERILIVAAIVPLAVLAVVLYLCDLVRKPRSW